jgi:hypothetical protein
MGPESNMNRVKLYRMNTEGNWDDKGTGYVSVEYDEVCYATCYHMPCFATQSMHRCWNQGKDSFVVVVLAEDDTTKLLMMHRIRKEITYYRQGGAQRLAQLGLCTICH